MKNELLEISRDIRLTISKRSPEILTGIGIAGMIMTTILAVKATPKALMLIDNKKAEKEDDYLTLKESIGITWKCYIPAMTTCILSTSCLIGASSVNVRRNAALATAYSLSETALKEYQTKVVETIGEKKEQTVRDAVAKDKIEKDPPANKEVFITDKANTLCYDSVSGRYFKTDIDKLKRAENDLNRVLRDEMSISLNEFYYEIGLPAIAIGDNIGWNIDKGYIDLDYSSHLTEDGTPCLVLEYKVKPIFNY